MSRSTENVLIVSQFFPPETMGGAHRWAELCKNLPEDINCRVLTSPPAFPYGEFPNSSKVVSHDEIETIPVTQLWTYQPRSDSRANESNLGRILNYVIFSILASVYVLLNGWRYDCVVTVSTPHTSFLPGIVATLLGRRWVVDVFDLWLDNAVELGYTNEGSLSYRYVSLLERLAIERSDAVTVITQTMADQFLEKYDVPAEKFTIVPFGVARNRFEPGGKRRDPNRIIYLGNLGDAYALAPFVRAVEQIPAEYTLELVGDGKRRGELESLVANLGISNRVIFTGYVSREKVPERLRRASLSIVPMQRNATLDYARPTKLLESMAVGTPFVASDVTEIRRLTEESGAGITVSNDPDEIAEAIMKILNNPERAAKMSEMAVGYINKNHRWEPLARTVASVLRAT